MTERLEKSAIKTAKSAPKGAARGSSVDFTWPSDTDEYRKLAKHVLVLVSVVTQDEAELPLRRVYVTQRQANRTDKAFQPAHQRGQGSLTSSLLGPYREDGSISRPPER